MAMELNSRALVTAVAGFKGSTSLTSVQGNGHSVIADFLDFLKQPTAGASYQGQRRPAAFATLNHA